MNPDVFAGSSFLITGATGLIGQALTRELLAYNETAERPVMLTLAIRDRQKAERMFGAESEWVRCVAGDICEVDLRDVRADYIVHAAAETSSRAFVMDPAGTIRTAVDGTRHLLEHAAAHPPKRFLYLSTMEVYGIFQSDERVDETHAAALDTMSVRSSYPESKRMCECLCASYGSQFGFPVNVLRLTQTFGRGVCYDDGRVFAEFARCAIEGRDIVLKTKGLTKRNYLGVRDAVSAILTVLANGTPGEAYNAANMETYCSISEMARFVAEELAGGAIRVRIGEEDPHALGFAPTLHMNLDASKLMGLGWRPRQSFREMYGELIDGMRESAGR